MDKDKAMAIWNRFIEESKPPLPPQEHEHTARSFARATGMPIEQARKFLDKKVKENELSFRIGTRNMKIYFSTDEQSL